MTRAGAPWSTAELLALLALRHVGIPFSRIPALLAEKGFPGRTRGACLGTFYRMQNADQRSEAA